MAAYNKFNQFVEDLVKGVHNFSAHTIKVYLSNTAPNAATHKVKADVAEIAAGNGYTAGGENVQATVSRTGGTVTVSGTRVIWTATGGSIGPFRYVVLYNDTPTNPADPLIAWWDYGTSITLSDGESFTVRFDNQPTTGTIFTLS